MQEGTPEWTPIIIEHHATWGTRLFVLYVFATWIFFVVRIVQIGLALWRARQVTRSAQDKVESPQNQGSFWEEIALASLRAQGLKRTAVLTLLFSLLASAYELLRMLHRISSENHVWYGAVAMTVNDALTIFVIGVLTCALLYAGFTFFEGRLSRMKLRFDDPKVTDLNLDHSGPSR